MSSFHLPTNFALQSKSSCPIDPVGAVLMAWTTIDRGRGLALWLDPACDGRGHAEIGISGMLPGRFYRLEGAPFVFARADAQGVLRIALRIEQSTLIALAPVV